MTSSIENVIKGSTVGGQGQRHELVLLSGHLRPNDQGGLTSAITEEKLLTCLIRRSQTTAGSVSYGAHGAKRRR